ncbi:hypothetical protein [Thermovibrio sp.]
MRFLTLIFLVFVFVGSTVYGEEKDRVLAYLDGKPITYSDLKSYVELLPGEKYKKMLTTNQGLKKLLGYYIDRQIILEEAKKSVSSREGSFNAHVGMDKDAAYIIAYLSKEISGKITISKEEVKQLAEQKHISENRAYAELLSQKRRQAYETLIEKLRAKHRIKVLVK